MDKRKRFYIALAVYAVLGGLVWTTMSDVPIPIPAHSKYVNMQALSRYSSVRGLTLVILALFAFRAFLHWKAEQIREQDGEQSKDLEG